MHFGSHHRVILEDAAWMPFRWSQAEAYMPEHTKYTPTTNIHPKEWSSKAELIQNNRPLEMQIVLTSICFTLQSHSHCSVTLSEPLQLHFAPTHLTAFTCFCFFCLVLRWSVLRENPSAFIACNSYWNSTLSSPCPRCLNEMKLIHCSFYCFQTSFLQMFPHFTRNHYTSVSVAETINPLWMGNIGLFWRAGSSSSTTINNSSKAAWH